MGEKSFLIRYFFWCCQVFLGKQKSVTSSKILLQNFTLKPKNSFEWIFPKELSIFYQEKRTEDVRCCQLCVHFPFSSVQSAFFEEEETFEKLFTGKQEKMQQNWFDRENFPLQSTEKRCKKKFTAHFMNLCWWKFNKIAWNCAIKIFYNNYDSAR